MSAHHCTGFQFITKNFATKTKTTQGKKKKKKEFLKENHNHYYQLQHHEIVFLMCRTITLT